jgi:hypothetical protein
MLMMIARGIVGVRSCHAWIEVEDDFNFYLNHSQSHTHFAPKDQVDEMLMLQLNKKNQNKQTF